MLGIFSAAAVFDVGNSSSATCGAETNFVVGL
jgi:hypothetical protein